MFLWIGGWVVCAIGLDWQHGGGIVVMGPGRSVGYVGVELDGNASDIVSAKLLSSRGKGQGREQWPLL